MRTLALATALLIGLAASLDAQTTIGAPGGDEVRSWGKPNTQTYGQTITGVGSFLNSFSFWLGRTSPISDDLTPDLDFRGYVYAWDAGLSRASGSALFSSPVMNYKTTEDAGFTRVDVNVGALAVNPGDMYVLFLSTSGLAGSGRIFWEASAGDTYAGGNWVYLNNGEDTGGWTSTSWNSGLVADARFEATFDRQTTSVPEPAGILLMAVGLLGLGFVRRRASGELEL